MKAARSRLALLCALGLCVACQPPLEEGRYGCATDSECPADWFCRADSRCWRTPVGVIDAGGVDGGGVDGGGGIDGGGIDAGEVDDAGPPLRAALA